MQRLILMRHATAQNSSSGGDSQRALSDHGLAEARAMGRALSQRGFKPDMALVSGAVRTRETWEAISEAFGDVDLHLVDALYNAPARTLRSAVEAAEDEAGCLLVLAHNPGVHELAIDYLIESAASPTILDRFTSGFPPASAAIFQVDVAGRCTFEGYLTPTEAIK
jgi:phosphohistidine phosphatase